MKKVAVILAGCGHKDGSEITEAVSLLISLHQAGASVRCFAPDIELDTIDHRSGENANPRRNVLTESARIARGEISDLNDLNVKDFDAIAFPGGYGAAKNLSNWAQKGAAGEVLPKIESLLRDFHAAGKPIAAICIAPHLVAKALGKKGVTVTIGDDPETAGEINKTGAHHENCPVNDYVTDRENKVITTPAYMYENAKPHEVFQGIAGLAKELVEMA
jgi:enhancing lycopene biosynthesis protein 2